MTIAVRLAVVLGVLFIVGAGLALLLPTEASGTPCGSVMAPEWDEDEVRELLEDGEDLYDSTDIPEFQGRAIGLNMAVRSSYERCSAKLEPRQTAGWTMLGAAVVVPVGVVFVSRGVGRRA